MYKETQNGAVAKSYMNNGQWPSYMYIGKYLRISLYIRKPFLIYDVATACSTQNFLIYEENLIFFLSVHKPAPPLKIGGANTASPIVSL
jgi:hypothetical protein